MEKGADDAHDMIDLGQVILVHIVQDNLRQFELLGPMGKLAVFEVSSSFRHSFFSKHFFCWAKFHSERNPQFLKENPASPNSNFF